MMERRDVDALSEEILDAIVTHPPSDACKFLVRMTSGTSGSSPLVLVTEYAPEAPNDMIGKCGLKNVVTCNGSFSARLANALVVSQAPDGEKMRVLSLVREDLAPSLEKVLSDYQPDSVFGFSSYIANALGYFAPAIAENVKRVTLVGESLSSVFEQMLRDQFPRAEQVEQYIAFETGGYIGNRFCRFLPRGHFHPARGVTISISDPDSDGIGDIRVTKNIYRDVRIEQYRVGDIGRFMPGVCACGEAVTFELIGRKGIDYIKLSGAILRREEFDRVAAMFAPLIHDYRVEARQISENGVAKGEITLRVFYRGGTFSPALLREVGEKFARNLFVSSTKTLSDFVSEGICAPLVMEFADGPFAQGYKDVKLMLRA